MSTSHAHSLCRLTNDRAVKTAEICIKGEQLRPQIHSLVSRYKKKTKQDNQHQEGNSRTCHLKRASPDLPHQESSAGPISRGVIAVCTTKGDVCLRHQKEWYCPWRSEGSKCRSTPTSQTPTGSAPCACHPAGYLRAAHLATDLTPHDSPAPHYDHSHWGDPVIYRD